VGYWDSWGNNLLLALLKHRLQRREKSVRFQLPTLQSAADATRAMAAITIGVAAGQMSPNEGTELFKLAEAYLKALEASEFEERLRAVEERGDATTP